MAQTKFTIAMRSAIVEKLREGHFAKVVCDWAGIAESTFHDWLNRGQAEMDDENSEYRDFALEVKKAKAEAEFHALGNIKKAADDGSWQASAWFLERSRSDRWAKAEWRAMYLKDKDKKEADDYVIDLSGGGQDDQDDSPHPSD